MKRRVLNLLTFLSLLPCVAVVVLRCGKLSNPADTLMASD